QCVGSRNDEHPYCSRVCCSYAIKNALRLKELNPKVNIFILYRDIRTYGFKEKYYLQARSRGVIFIRYDEQEKPRVTETDGKLQVRLIDPILAEEVVIRPDLLVLSTGMVAENEELAKILKVPLTSDGFFMEAHAKIRPLDFTTDGMFVCGLAHSPRFIDESIAQAKGASIRAVTVLSKERIEAKAEVVKVNEKWCTGCGICELMCPYDAREIDEERKVAKVIEAVCQGCGACVTACPSGASQQQGFETEEVFSMVDFALVYE
ncbi:MAG: 4Fe-4S dicluster domain-containing protein, partial [Candidatus Bathyarchaeia archaeon]